MNLIANENMPGTAVQLLRDHGHDVYWVKESMRGADDPTVLAAAQAEGRIVVTQDMDFGELAFHCGLPAQCGVILFRLAGTNPVEDCRRIADAIEGRADWAGHFPVVTADRIRIRALPG